MTVRKLLAASTMALMAMAAAPATASADWILTPFIGVNFSGSADVNDSIAGASLDNKFEHKLDYGASLGWMGGGIAGLEFDFGYSPNFFETGTATNNAFDFTNDSNVTTLTGNLILGGSSGSIRPYVVGGVGLIRTNVQDASGFFDKVSSNDFGYDLGAGVMGFFSNAVGLRGDVRYFRSFQDNDPGNGTDFGLSNFHFWRGTLGLSLKF